MKSGSFLLFSILLFFGIGCQSKQEQNSTVAISTYQGPDTASFYSRTDKMKDHVLGKKISSLRTILDQELGSDKKYLIYYITGQDCSSCVLKGFNHIKTFSSNFKQSIFPVGSGVNIGNIQLNYDYESIIYPDNQDRIRVELGYFHSPMFLLYSEKNGVEDVYFIPTFDDGGKGESFFGRINLSGN